MLLVSISTSVLVVVASDGVTIYFTIDGGLGAGVGINGGVNLAWFPTIESSTDLEGWGATAGGSAGEGNVGESYDANVALTFNRSQDGELIIGDQWWVDTFTPLGGIAGAEGHLTINYSWIITSFSWDDMFQHINHLSKYLEMSPIDTYNLLVSLKAEYDKTINATSNTSTTYSETPSAGVSRTSFIASFRITYIVKSKDTVWDLAQRFNTTVEQIEADNNIDPETHLIIPDQQLLINVNLQVTE